MERLKSGTLEDGQLERSLKLKESTQGTICTLKRVQESVSNCDMIEENLLVPYEELKKTSRHQETLEVTEARQFRERGLNNIYSSKIVM